MSEKKNIDRLFQEQFKDFEAAPPEYVWDNIREALEEKKKRRVIPLWFRLSGVAAILLVGLFLGWDYLAGNAGNDIHAPQQVVTAPDGQRASEQGGAGLPAGGSKDNIQSVPDDGQQVAGTGNDSGSNPDTRTDNSANKTGAAPGNITNNQGAVVKSSKGNNLTTTTATAVADYDSAETKNNKKGNARANKRVGSTVTTTATAVVNNDTPGNAQKMPKASHKVKDKQDTNGTNNKHNVFSVTNVEGIASNNEADKSGKEKVSDKNIGTLQDADVINNITNNGLASGTVRKTGKEGEQDSKINNNKGGVIPESTVLDKGAAPEEVMAAVTVDTVKPQPENALEKLLKEKEEGKKDEQLADATSPKWNIKPQVAPVFYNSLSGGSPIDAQFASNSKSFDNDLSYGLGINYAVNNRLSVRTGVNRVNLNYATQGIEFYASLEGATNNIATARSRNATIIVQNQDIADPLLSANAMKESYSGAMVQSTGYVEIPLEMSYSLLNKRFGIAVIGGVSTLLLNENNVSVVSTQGLTTNVGEAENLNNIHFSTNVGLGFRYRFFKSFEANFEPMFKYQVNTYSRDAGNFKPYFIGLYSGISFSF